MTIEPLEFSVVLLASSHNPSVLNPDFLRYNEIVPEDWEAGPHVVTTDAYSQVVFEHQGVAIASQPNRVLFTQQLLGRDFEASEVAEIASAYIATLPHVNYLAVGINPKAFLGLTSHTAARTYIADRFISDGPWKTINGSLGEAKLVLTYELPDSRFSLTIESGTLPSGADSQRDVISFVGNFHRPVSGKGTKLRSESAQRILRAWKADLRTFVDILEARFVGETT